MVVRRPAFNDVIVLRQRESHKDTKDTERIGKGCGKLSLHPLCLCDGIELHQSHRPTHIPGKPEQEYL